MTFFEKRTTFFVIVYIVCLLKLFCGLLPQSNFSDIYDHSQYFICTRVSGSITMGDSSCRIMWTPLSSGSHVETFLTFWVGVLNRLKELVYIVLFSAAFSRRLFSKRETFLQLKMQKNKEKRCSQLIFFMWTSLSHPVCQCDSSSSECDPHDGFPLRHRQSSHSGLQFSEKSTEDGVLTFSSEKAEVLLE